MEVFASSWSRKLRPFEYRRRRLQTPEVRKEPGHRPNRWVRRGGGVVAVVVVVVLCVLRDAVGPAAAGDGDAAVDGYVAAAVRS